MTTNVLKKSVKIETRMIRRRYYLIPVKKGVLNFTRKHLNFRQEDGPAVKR